ncbi:MAG: NHL repeat-containing protein [Melioribacteraceae bacterium]|nr:NHL repeat-containing protein [Melioribacteraceae bacterium]
MKISILLLLLLNFNFAQSIIFRGEIGEFESASAFTLTPGEVFFVTDLSKNEIVKLDTLGNIIESIGGYGWSSSTFDEPVDIFATDLRVYVTDKNNNRIQVFDKDINYLFLIQTDEQTDDINNFQYPTSCATSIQGDIYILDSDNTRIMKFNSEGNFLLEFGNYDSGDYMLSSPTQLALSQDSKIFVLDENKLIVYDQYGMGLLKLNSKIEPENINITFNNLIVNTTDSLFYLNLQNPNSRFVNITPNNLDEDIEIIEGIIYNRNLYILTETQILHYTIILE